MARVVGVVLGEAFDRMTWSGASHHLFGALQRRGALQATVDARPPVALEYVAKAAAVWPRRRRWVERYELSPIRRAARGWRATRRVAAADPEVVLQIGAYLSVNLRPRLRCSFHDSNLALFSRLWTDVEDPGARHVRREMAREREVFDGLDLIMTMSDWLRESFIADFGQDPSKVVTVGSGANVTRVPDTPDHRDFSRPRLLFIGLEWERKGGPQLLAAFGRLRAERPEAELWVVGQEKLEEVDGVRWCGRIDRNTSAGDAEMERLHREATLYVMPSVYDPMPNVFLEAMMWGLPCIGSRACSMPEIIDGGVTGLLAPPGATDELYQLIRRLTDDPGLAQRMGLAGRRRVLERFTWDRVAGRMLAAIEERL